jgi:hypothetical protein
MAPGGRDRCTGHALVQVIGNSFTGDPKTRGHWRALTSTPWGT